MQSRHKICQTIKGNILKIKKDSIIILMCLCLCHIFYKIPSKYIYKSVMYTLCLKKDSCLFLTKEYAQVLVNYLED